MPATMTSAQGASAYSTMGYRATRFQADAVVFSARSGETPVRSWSQFIDDLLALRGLQDDWDGQGALAPHPAVVDGAITLAQAFRAEQTIPADRVIAGVNGTIFFEWYDAGAYTEIEVTAPDRAEGRTVEKGSGTAKVFYLTRHASI